MIHPVGRCACSVAVWCLLVVVSACGGGGDASGSGGASSGGTSGGGSSSGSSGSSSSSSSSSGSSSSSSSSSSGGPTGNCDITITTSDSYIKIESATAGQVVCISPGTYHFRVTLSKTGTANAPIVIRALDPTNRPVFDYTSNSHDVTGWPGSYSASDDYRSAWRVTGSYYTIDGIVIQGANNAYNNWSVNDNTAGIRYLNSTNLTVRNSRLYNNDMGIQGGGSNTIVEYSEFDSNGNPGSDQSHNIYILGGDNFTLRNSYSHDCRGGQNFHIRARNATVAYNWFENASDYEGDMMTNQASYDPGINGVQDMLFIGNVVIQNQAPDNEIKLIQLYNDGGGTNVTMNIAALWNTFVFKQTGRGTNTAAIRFSTATLKAGTVIFSNNIVAAPEARTAISSDGGGGTLVASGTNNLFPTGSSVSPLLGTKFAADVLFTNAASKDYSLQASSPAVGYASTSVAPQPTWKYSAPPAPSVLLSGRISARTSATNLGAVQ
jgi:hypothetical protein